MIDTLEREALIQEPLPKAPKLLAKGYLGAT